MVSLCVKFCETCVNHEICFSVKLPILVQLVQHVLRIGLEASSLRMPRCNHESRRKSLFVCCNEMVCCL